MPLLAHRTEYPSMFIHGVHHMSEPYISYLLIIRVFIFHPSVRQFEAFCPYTNTWIIQHFKATCTLSPFKQSLNNVSSKQHSLIGKQRGRTFRVSLVQNGLSSTCHSPQTFLLTGEEAHLSPCASASDLCYLSSNRQPNHIAFPLTEWKRNTGFGFNEN